MRKVLFPLFFMPITFVSFSQQQLPNASFEDWEDVGTALQEPKHWSSLKTADVLAAQAPEVLNRVAGRTGNWAIQLEVKSVFGINANGIITNGRVHADYNPANGYVFTDPNNEKWHTDFTSRPDSIVGWYKFNPSGNDNGKIEILLHKGGVGQMPPNQETIDNTIGGVRYTFSTAQTEWTRFSAPFSYSSSENPDYILVAINPGDSITPNVGSKISIDDLELIYNSTGLNEQAKPEIAVKGANGYLYFGLENEENVVYQVVDYTGKIIQQGTAKPKVAFQHESGIYLVRIQTPGNTFVKKLYIR